MKKSRVIELLWIERECMRRASGKECGRDCGNCGLVQDSDELLEMYGAAIALIDAYAERSAAPGTDETRKGLMKCWKAFHGMEHELYADYVFDALYYLLDRAPVKPMKRYGVYYCGACKERLHMKEQKYCMECGRQVDWGEVDGK